MKRLLSALAVMVAMVTVGGPTSAQVSQPEEFCTGSLTGTVLCQAVGVNYLPEGIGTHECDANGHAPSGALDQTANLQDWINSVPDGYFANGYAAVQVLSFPEGRCIRMDGELKVHDRNYLIFDGNDVTIDQHLMPATLGFQGSGGWSVVRGTFLQWRFFKIVGNHAEYRTDPADSTITTKIMEYGYCHDGLGTCEFQYGWEISGSRHVRLDGNETKNTHGDSVAIGWDYPLQPPNAIDARYITINNHKVFGTGRQGISAVSGQDIAITNSYIEGATQVAIDIEQEQPLFPVRRWNISNNRFGQSYAAIGQLGALNTCTEVSDISFSHNVQVEPNVTVYPALMGTRPGGSCTVQRGPIEITNNVFWAEEWGSDGDHVVIFDGYSDVTVNSNTVKLSCYPGAGCAGNQAPVTFLGGTGHEVSRNDLAVIGAQPWSSVYAYNGVVHGSLGVNVNSCGNTTAQGANQPNPCFPALP
jgi:hypothetical protein